MGKQWKQWQTLFWGGSEITADAQCNHDINRRLLLGRKVMTILDSILKSRDITLPTKVHVVKMVFPIVMYGCMSWTIKNTECQRTNAFKLWCRRRLFRVPWTARRSNQSVLKDISPENSLEGLMLKLKLQYSNTDVKSWLIGKDPVAGKDWRREKGTTEDEMVGWHQWLNGHEFEQTLGDSEGQGSLTCYVVHELHAVVHVQLMQRAKHDWETEQ